MAVQLVMFVLMLACVAPPALCVTEQEGDVADVEITCCQADKELSLDFKNAHQCVKPSGSPDGKSDQPSEDEKCVMTRCAMEENGLLNEDKTIKEEAFKQLYLKQADPDAKEVVRAALDKCFGEFNKNPEKKKEGPCKDGMDPLMSCYSDEIIKTCPEKLWNKDEPECQATREKLAKNKQ